VEKNKNKIIEIEIERPACLPYPSHPKAQRKKMRKRLE
jgi:hypothetical protein